MGGTPYGIGKYFMSFGPFGGLLTVLFFIFVIYLLFRIVKSFIPPTSEAKSDRNDSLMILKNRFARGEINHEEYRQMFEILKQ